MEWGGGLVVLEPLIVSLHGLEEFELSFFTLQFANLSESQDFVSDLGVLVQDVDVFVPFDAQ